MADSHQMFINGAVGSVVSKEQQDRVIGFVDRAKEAGADRACARNDEGWTQHD